MSLKPSTPSMASTQLFPDSSSDSEPPEDITVNHEYARRFEHNKRREDIHRLAELQQCGEALSSSSSDSDAEGDDDDAVVSARGDLQFFDALVKIKHEDPVIHLKDAKLYTSGDEDVQRTPLMRESKPLYIKDVTARHLLENGPELEEDEAPIESQGKIYSKEQEENRQKFLEATEGFEGEDDDGEFFKEKEWRGNDQEETKEDMDVRRKMDEYWGDDGNLDEDELFLKNFLRRRMWAGKGEAEKPTADDKEVLSEDEDTLERQEQYEAKYNFRFEEGAEDRVLGHSRTVEGSVRKKSNVRKEQRKRREERMAQSELERREELKHLKNLKMREIRERVEKIRTVAGIREGGGCMLDEEVLDEEFDPEKYDRKMTEVFGTEYYNAEDVDPEFGSADEGGLEKPNFDVEDALLGLPKGWDNVATGEGFRAARGRSIESKREYDGIKDDGGAKSGEESVEGELQSNGKRKRKHKISLREKVELDKELEEYYKLDYEDTIGDLKTRFKYKVVPANKYGLNTAEILMADERDLNQYVSLKKLAPYRQDDWKVHKAKRHQMKMKLYGGKKEEDKEGKKKYVKDSKHEKFGNQIHDVVPNEEASGDDYLSRRAKRRRRQSELKLSQSRLMAYGKIPQNTKKHKKH